MGDKDITERSLEWFNDVFSDIVNAWFAVNSVKGFTVMPEDLSDALTRTAYKSGGEVRDAVGKTAHPCAPSGTRTSLSVAITRRCEVVDDAARQSLDLPFGL